MSAENSEETQSGAVDRGQILLIALVALALIASVVMLVTDSNSALKLALLAALWAAVIGFFLVFRYRRQAEQSKEQLEHERELHEANTAKAAAQHKAEQERSTRERQDKERSAEAETLAQIQGELEELRTHLEMLTGRELGYEPAALRAQARRIMELEAETSGESQGPPVKGAPSTAAVTGLLGQTPKEPLRREEPSDGDVSGDAGPADNGSAGGASAGSGAAGGGTAAVSEKPAASTSGDSASRAPGSSDSSDSSASADEDANSKTRTFDTGSFTSVKWDQGGARHVADSASGSSATGSAPSASSASDTSPAGKNGATGKDAGSAKAEVKASDSANTSDSAKAEVKAGGEQAAEPAESEEEFDHRGRRRRDERRDSLSVADLMANLRKGED